MPDFLGADHTHGFASGGVLLRIFQRLGLLQADLGDERQLNQENLDRVCALIEASLHAPLSTSTKPNYADKFSSDEKYCDKVHSHEHLQTIFDLLWNGDILRRGSFCDHVFRLIFFHQSLLGQENRPFMVIATEEERKKYCDPELL